MGRRWSLAGRHSTSTWGTLSRLPALNFTRHSSKKALANRSLSRTPTVCKVTVALLFRYSARRKSLRSDTYENVERICSSSIHDFNVQPQYKGNLGHEQSQKSAFTSSYQSLTNPTHSSAAIFSSPHRTRRGCSWSRSRTVWIGLKSLWRCQCDHSRRRRYAQVRGCGRNYRDRFLGAIQ